MWKVNRLQKNYLFTKDLVFTYVGKYGGPTWFVSKIEEIVLKEDGIHLIFFSRLDVKLELDSKIEEIYKHLQKIYFSKK